MGRRWGKSADRLRLWDEEILETEEYGISNVSRTALRKSGEEDPTPVAKRCTFSPFFMFPFSLAALSALMRDSLEQ